MKSKKNIPYFFRNLRVKHRLSLRDQHNDNEVWYMHLSPLEMIASFFALVLVLFLIIITTVAYTPVLDMIPGYPGNKSREILITNITRLDSLERRLDQIQTYTNNVGLIMGGKVPITRNTNQAGDSLRSTKVEMVDRSRADSILRGQIEGDGAYKLAERSSTQKVKLAELDLISPVKGVVAVHFDPKQSQYGVGIATAPNQEVTAIAAGTVVLAMWTPNDGYITQIQHSNNIISIYRKCSQILKIAGARVASGEVIGYTGEGLSGEAGSGYFDFELWYDGSPVNPESHITF